MRKVPELTISYEDAAGALAFAFKRRAPIFCGRCSPRAEQTDHNDEH